MASIHGFNYEPWERSSSIARRDYRHSHDEPVEKYFKGSTKPKSSPNKKRGCPENDGNAHVYAVVKFIRHYYFNGRDREFMHHAKMCIGCNKVKKHLWGYTGEVFDTIVERF